MVWLLLVSFIWAFSFGLIKGRLAGLDPVAVAVARTAIATLVFVPWIRYKPFGATLISRLALVGALQFGLMYILYLRAFAFLQAYEVALFTITTPLYLVLFDAISERRWEARFLLASGLAIAGAGVAVWSGGPNSTVWSGFILLQASNLCFAAGQLAYRRLRPTFSSQVSDRHAFAWLGVGALLACTLASLATTSWTSFRPSPEQWLVLVYLGAVASGLGFFLWNLGATQVNAGVLAVCNNLKIPLAIACSLLFFKEQANLYRLGTSLALMALALWIVERRFKSSAGKR